MSHLKFVALLLRRMNVVHKLLIPLVHLKLKLGDRHQVRKLVDGVELPEHLMTIAQLVENCSVVLFYLLALTVQITCCQ